MILLHDYIFQFYAETPIFITIVNECATVPRLAHHSCDQASDMLQACDSVRGVAREFCLQ